MKQQDEGFTLIELLIVIVILGILAAVVVFAVGGITDQGEDSACQSDYKTLEVAVEAYYAQEGDYPTNISSLLIDNTPGGQRQLLRSAPEYVHLSGASGSIGINATNYDGSACP